MVSSSEEGRIRGSIQGRDLTKIKIQNFPGKRKKSQKRRLSISSQPYMTMHKIDSEPVKNNDFKLK